MCARRGYRREREDAVRRETDGECAPAAMKGGGEERREGGREEEDGVADCNLPSETTERERGSVKT